MIKKFEDFKINENILEIDADKPLQAESFSISSEIDDEREDPGLNLYLPSYEQGIIWKDFNRPQGFYGNWPKSTQLKCESILKNLDNEAEELYFKCMGDISKLLIKASEDILNLEKPHYEATPKYGLK
jgi:hypothetical protein